jgi:hypothetical protein
MRTRVRLPLACLLGLAAVIGVPASPAHAVAYRYWTYWHAAPDSPSWAFAGSGPTYRPSPGAVEGWRFAVSQGTGNAPPPRTDPAKAYSRACGSRTADSGQKVVALVVDYGTTSDRPPGEKPPGGVVATCTQIASNGSGFDVLRAANVPVREKGGLICGLNGYPRSECAPVVASSPSASPSKSPTPSPTPAPSHPSSPSHSPTPSPTPPSSRTSSTRSSATSSAKATQTSQASTTFDSSSPVSPSDQVSASLVGSSSAVAADAEPSLAVGDISGGSSRGRPWALVAGVILLLVLSTAGLRARRRP